MPVESLGRYRIEKELGRGAMGQVFLAYDPQIERRGVVERFAIEMLDVLPVAPAMTTGATGSDVMYCGQEMQVGLGCPAAVASAVSS